jgi:hypothetical protein
MKWNGWNGPSPLGHGLPGLVHGAFQSEAEAGELHSTRQRRRFQWAAAPWGVAVGQRDGRWGVGLNLVTGEGGGSPEGGVHGGTAQPEGNDSKGWRSVVEVDGSRLEKAVRTHAVVGAASMEHVGGWRQLGSGQRLEQRWTARGRAKRMRWERWSGEVKKSSFTSEPRRAEDKDARGGARGRPRWSSSHRRVAEQLARVQGQRPGAV